MKGGGCGPQKRERGGVTIKGRLAAAVLHGESVHRGSFADGPEGKRICGGSIERKNRKPLSWLCLAASCPERPNGRNGRPSEGKRAAFLSA